MPSTRLRSRRSRASARTRCGRSRGVWVDATISCAGITRPRRTLGCQTFASFLLTMDNAEQKNQCQAALLFDMCTALLGAVDDAKLDGANCCLRAIRHV